MFSDEYYSCVELIMSIERLILLPVAAKLRLVEDGRQRKRYFCPNENSMYFEYFQSVGCCGHLTITDHWKSSRIKMFTGIVLPHLKALGDAQ